VEVRVSIDKNLYIGYNADEGIFTARNQAVVTEKIIVDRYAEHSLQIKAKCDICWNDSHKRTHTASLDRTH
jgi:hypothetical protein